MIEFLIELREQEGRQPMLDGVMIQEGRAATGGRREVFAPGSIEWPGQGVGIATEHRGEIATRGHVVRERDGKLRVTALATEPILAAYRKGKQFLSVEVAIVSERLTQGGVREILRAVVPSAALVSNPEYDTATVAIRSAEDDRKGYIWL